MQPDITTRTRAEPYKGTRKTSNGDPHPQNREPDAEEVVVTREESAFLDYLLESLDALQDPFAIPDPSFANSLKALRQSAGLTPMQSDFIKAWIEYKGDLLTASQSGELDPSRYLRCLSSPSVLRILQTASRLCDNVPSPVASKEEIAATWTEVSRSQTAPLSFQRDARQELAKMMGYYPAGSDGMNVGVQIILKGDLDDG